MKIISAQVPVRWIKVLDSQTDNLYKESMHISTSRKKRWNKFIFSDFFSVSGGFKKKKRGWLMGWRSGKNGKNKNDVFWQKKNKKIFFRVFVGILFLLLFPENEKNGTLLWFSFVFLFFLISFSRIRVGEFSSEKKIIYISQK